jgi:RNA polymerase sigma-70 factor (ECF subfamily)
MNALNSEEEDAREMVRLAGGHDASLDALMDRHAEKLFHYLVRSLQNEEDAADLAQETFVRIYQNRAQFDRAQKFTTWLYSIAANLVRDRYRWRSRHQQVSLDVEREGKDTRFHETLPSPEHTPDESLEFEERSEAVRNAVAALPEELRQPLILATYQELPQAEIAAILKCSVKAVETRIYRARQQLRTRLAPLLPAT